MLESGTEVRQVLGDLSELLSDADEKWWLRKAEAAQKLESSEQQARQVRSWFGGMGSLNDLILCKINGHKVAEKDRTTINARLAQVRTALQPERNSGGT